MKLIPVVTRTFYIRLLLCDEAYFWPHFQLLLWCSAINQLVLQRSAGDDVVDFSYFHAAPDQSVQKCKRMGETNEKHTRDWENCECLCFHFRWSNASSSECNILVDSWQQRIISSKQFLINVSIAKSWNCNYGCILSGSRLHHLTNRLIERKGRRAVI